VAVLDANAVPKDADVVVNRSMYIIFFKVDEVIRDEDDFNPDEDDLLADDDQAKDQDMEDMDESEPFGENETNPAHQTNSTNAFNDDEGEIYKTMEPVHDEVTKLGEEQGQVNEMVAAYVAGVDKIPHSEGGGIIEYSAEAIEEPLNQDDAWKQGLVMVTSVVEATEGVQQMQHESVASDVAVLPDAQHEVEATEVLCLNVEPAGAAAGMSVAPDAAMIVSLGAIAKVTHTDMEKRTAGEMFSAVQDETRVASFKVVSGSEALGGVVLLRTEEDIGLTVADPVVKIQGEEEDAPSVSEGIEALLSGSANNPVRQEVLGVMQAEVAGLAQVAAKVPESEVTQLMISGADDTIKGQQTNAVGTTVPKVSQLEIEEPHHDKLAEQAAPFVIAEAQGATEIADAQVEDVAGYPERDLGQEHVEVDQPKQGLEQLSQPEIRDAALETEELQIGLSKVGRSKEPTKKEVRKINQDTTLRRSKE
jgi:hypothetical protein